MKHLVRLVTLLYPSWWRRRYGAELDALLDDMKPGWRVLADVFYGACAMQIKAFGRLAVTFVLIGAFTGPLVAWLIPRDYVSSSIVRLEQQAGTTSEDALMVQLRPALERVLPTDAGRDATTVEVVDKTSTQTTLRVAYYNRNAAEAQRMAQSITAAVASSGGPASTASVINAPALPARPIPPSFESWAASGALIGLLVSLVIAVASQRQSPTPAG